MILVLHGENKVASRKVLLEKIKSFQKKGGEIIRLNGEKVDLTTVKQAVEAKSLFGGQQLVVVEDFFSRPKGALQKTVLDYWQKLPEEINLIFWENKKLTPSQLKELPQRAKVHSFKIKPVIFKFLDSLKPDNARQSLPLLKICLSQESPEMIFYMLCRQVRLLILAKDMKRKGLENMPVWMQNKFLKQSQSFTLERLLKLHRELVKIDYKQKTGQALLPLPSQLDLLVANL